MKTYSMEEEIKQKLELGFNPKYAGATNDLLDLISQALLKRDSQIIKMLENTDVQMSVNGDVGQDEIAMAKFIYKAHIRHIIKKIESAIIPPNSINGTLPSETDSAIK